MADFTQFSEQLMQEAVEAYPNEAVWVIVDAGCFQVENIAEDPTTSFEVDPRVMAGAWKRGLKAVAHSHPDSAPVPSAADMRSQIEFALPFGIVSTDGEGAMAPTWFGYQDKADIPPLVGRQFYHGITDCYTLIRDYYFLEHDIRIPEFPRDWEWWLKGDNLYLEGAEKAGFVRILQDEAQPGDMWFAQLRSDVPNHGGILIENDLTLHHPGSGSPYEHSRLSRREPIQRWLEHITHWYRHKEMM